MFGILFFFILFIFLWLYEFRRNSCLLWSWKAGFVWKHPSVAVSLQWWTQAPPRSYSWLHFGSLSSSSRLCPLSQQQPSAQAHLLNPWFQHPAPTCTSRCVPWTREFWDVPRTSVLVFLSSAFHTPAVVLSYKSLKPPLLSQIIYPLKWRGSSGEGTFLLSQFPPKGKGPISVLQIH